MKWREGGHTVLTDDRKDIERTGAGQSRSRESAEEEVKLGEKPIPQWPQVSFISRCICQQETQEWLESATPLLCSCVGCFINEETDAFPLTASSCYLGGHGSMQPKCAAGFSISQQCDCVCSLSRSTR